MRSDELSWVSPQMFELAKGLYASRNREMTFEQDNGQKITITSDKPQTTRNNISGIYTCETSQLIFIDTPGIHKPKHKLGTFMTNEAINTLNTVDLVLFMVLNVSHN